AGEGGGGGIRAADRDGSLHEHHPPGEGHPARPDPVEPPREPRRDTGEVQELLEREHDEQSDEAEHEEVRMDEGELGGRTIEQVVRLREFSVVQAGGRAEECEGERGVEQAKHVENFRLRDGVFSLICTPATAPVESPANESIKELSAASTLFGTPMLSRQKSALTRSERAAPRAQVRGRGTRSVATHFSRPGGCRCWPRGRQRLPRSAALPTPTGRSRPASHAYGGPPRPRSMETVPLRARPSPRRAGAADGCRHETRSRATGRAAGHDDPTRR